MAEAWNGTNWTIEKTPDPDGSLGSELLGVSCVSASSCSAVGYETDGSGNDVLLAETWDGTTWTIEKTPAAPTTGRQLSAVSCSSTSACTAVGFVLTSSGGQSILAETWTGTRWVVDKTHLPPGGAASQLSAVSCLSASWCQAVGQYFDSAGTDFGLAEAWRGGDWVVEKTPGLAAAPDAALLGLACLSSHLCMSVGGVYGTAPLAEGWNGSQWLVEKTVVHRPPAYYALSAVSCRSTTSCTAVGSVADRGNQSTPVGEAWNGTVWASENTPGVVGAVSSELSAVSCTSTAQCTAVGDYVPASGTDATLAEVWDGSRWSLEKMPLPPAGSDGSALTSVSCRASTVCVAVGQYQVKATPFALAEVWNGTSWFLADPRLPSGSTESSLASVSCVSASACTAAGWYWTKARAGMQAPLAETWNGTSWSIETPPVPDGAKEGRLEGVSCSSASQCMAVGTYFGSTTSLTLAERWNGSAWSIEKTPNPAGAQLATELDSASCPASGGCTAVGNFIGAGGAFMTFAESWTGTKWAVEKTPTPTGGNPSDPELTSVSCTSVHDCTSVGDYIGSSGAGVTLAESWNGLAWTIEKTPSPPGPQQVSTLSGVSCTTSCGCVAVGATDDGNGATNAPMIESTF